MTDVFFWTAIGFFLGSIPFAYLLARLLTGKDIRQIGDGNPGGTNAWKAGGWQVGLLVGLLEVFKAYAPVYFARRYGVAEWELVPVGLAPILGHALQPWLGFRGGKALGVTGGAWLALEGWIILPVYASLTLPVLALQVEHAWAAFSGMFALLGYAWLVDGSAWMRTFALLNLLLIGWTHRRELRRAPRLRPWLGNLFSGRGA